MKVKKSVHAKLQNMRKSLKKNKEKHLNFLSGV